MSRLTRSHSMGAAAMLMAASIFASRIMGLVRDKVISWQFGAGADTDVYFAAFVVPDFINYLLAGGYMSMTLIPLLSARFTRDTPQPGAQSRGEDDGWDFFSTVLFWNTAAICLLTLAAFIGAPELARLTAPGFDNAQLNRLTLYLRILLPGQIFFIMGACLTALLYVRKSFAVPALTPLIYNGCIILGGLAWPFFAPRVFGQGEATALQGMTGYALGATIGAALGAFALPLYAAWAGGLHVRLRLYHPLIGRYVRLALPLMLGQSIVILDEQLVRVFGSLAGEGVVSLLNYARRIMLVPVGVVAQAAGVASFPFLAGLAAAQDHTAFHSTLNTALRRGLFVMLPVTAWMIAAAYPILGLIFEGGRFGAADTAHSTPLLQCLLIGVPFWLIQQVVGRAFYAWQNTLAPALLGSLVTLAVLPLYPLAARMWLGTGVAAVSAASIILYALILCLWWTRCHGTHAWRGLVRPISICGLLALIAAVTSYGVMHAVDSKALLMSLGAVAAKARAHGLLDLAAHGLTLCIGGLTFVLLYAGLARLTLPEALRIRRTDA